MRMPKATRSLTHWRSTEDTRPSSRRVGCLARLAQHEADLRRATGRCVALLARQHLCIGGRRQAAARVRTRDRRALWRAHALIFALSWDTRGGSKPTSTVRAHDAEVNTVAFAPSNSNILLTGSADKVARGPCRHYQPLADHATRRLLACGTFATSSSSCTRLRATKKRSCSSPGRPTTRPSSRPRLATAVSTSGTSQRLGSSRRPRTRKTGPQSSCLSTEGTRAGQPTSRGTSTRPGRSQPPPRTTSCRCGRPAPRCIPQMTSP